MSGVSLVALVGPEQKMAQAPSAQAWVRLWMASAQLGQADLVQAGCWHDGVVRVPPDSPHVCLAAGRVAESHGALSQALQAYEAAQRLRPQDPLAAIWRAHVLARLGRYAQADALFALVGQTYAWPARVTRMGVDWWAGLDQGRTLVQAWPLDGDWLVPAPSRVGTVVLVSCDGAYWLRYGADLLRSWAALLQKQGGGLGVGPDAAAGRVPLCLHVQLLNADAAVQAQVAALARQVGAVSVCHVQVALPSLPSFGPQSQRMAEHRTWFAAARLLCLPAWLERVDEGVVVTDLDVQWHADPREVWALMGHASAGAVRFDSRQRVLWEEWYMTLAAFRATPQGKSVASDVARYVAHFLHQGDGVWGLDQAALWSVFAKHGGPLGLEGARPGSAVVALPPSAVRWRGGPAHALALLSTGVASQAVEAGPRLYYTRNFEDVMLQRVFADVAQGCYVDVGASAPVWDSNTYALYRLGWRGLAVEPLDYAALWRSERPDDVFVQAAAGDVEGELTLHVYNQAQQISTASPETRALWAQRQIRPDAQRTVPVHRLSALWDRHFPAGREVHVLSVDVEGMERQVLLGLDWARHRPWLVLVEAVVPGVSEPTHKAWEDVLLAAQYAPVYFDGVNRFYLAQERMHLRDRLQLPPNVWDNFVSAQQKRLELQVQALQAQVQALQAQLTLRGA